MREESLIINPWKWVYLSGSFILQKCLQRQADFSQMIRKQETKKEYMSFTYSQLYRRDS